jgi:hypothetical protein
VPGDDEISLHNSDAIIVDWDGENDPANPMNWSKAKRISQVVLVSAITMVTLVFTLRVSLILNFAKNSAIVHLQQRCLLQVLTKS